MHRSFWWSAIVILAVLVAPLAGMFGAPAKPVWAEPLAPAVPPPDDEVILLTSTGQIRVDDPVTPSGYKPATWDSGSDQGWTMVAAGDFNGDGDAEIVATKSDVIKVFDPIVQPGRQPVVFERSLGANRIIQLLVTGDFDGDGRDEIAIIHYDPGVSLPYKLVVYDGGTNATAAEWTVRYQESYNATWLDMAAGDVNNDGADDLVMVRNVDRRVKVYNGSTWTTLAEQAAYATDWLAVATGNLYAAYAGDEIALLRRGISAQVNGLILLRVAGNTFSDLGGTYRYNPDFTSIATGDVNGDGDDEVLMLRNPIDNRTSLLMVNPSGAAIRDFAEATGHTAPLFTIVRMGDVDGDGRAEVIIEKTNRYRIYYDPQANNSYVDYTGAFRTMGTVSNIPTMAVANIDGSGVLSGPVLRVSPLSLSFALEYRQPSPTQTINITNSSTSDVISWQAQVVGSAPWLKLAATSGTTPGTLGVSVDSNQLAPSQTPYTARIQISATAPGNVQGSPQEVTVSVTISGVTMVVSPTVLNFVIGYGDTVAAKQVTVSSQGGSAPFGWRAAVQGGASWLLVSPQQGTSPTTVSVSVNSRANPPGDYLGSIMFVADDPNIANPIQYVTVRLTVNDAGLVVLPDMVAIWQEIGAPRVQREVLIERPGIPTNWAASAVPVEGFAILEEALAAGRFEVTEEGLRIEGLGELPPVDNWLSFAPTSGTTPTTMILKAKDYTPGTYHAIITVVAANPDVPNRTRQIHVVAHLVPEVHTSFLPVVFK